MKIWVDPQVEFVKGTLPVEGSAKQMQRFMTQFDKLFSTENNDRTREHSAEISTIFWYQHAIDHANWILQ